MSPRKADPANRAVLIDIFARLLSEEGPSALSTRRLAAEAGTSTMAVYTHFGSMSELVREIARDGFARLERMFKLIEPTGDPVSDMAMFGRAYRHNASSGRHIFSVMFGGSSLGGFALTDDDRQYGRYTLSGVADCAGRCIASGRFRAGDPILVAHQMWLGVHGTVSIELGGYLVDPYDADRCFEAQLLALMVGCGDTPELATESVSSSREPFAEGPWPTL